MAQDKGADGEGVSLGSALHYDESRSEAFFSCRWSGKLTKRQSNLHRVQGWENPYIS